MTAVQILVKELRETDTLVMNPAARPTHVIESTELAITRQKYGVSYTALETRDGAANGRYRSALRYTDLVWVRR